MLVAVVTPVATPTEMLAATSTVEAAVVAAEWKMAAGAAECSLVNVVDSAVGGA
jgi:hypothetical protein